MEDTVIVPTIRNYRSFKTGKTITVVAILLRIVSYFYIVGNGYSIVSGGAAFMALLLNVICSALFIFALVLLFFFFLARNDSLLNKISSWAGIVISSIAIFSNIMLYYYTTQ